MLWGAAMSAAVSRFAHEVYTTTSRTLHVIENVTSKVLCYVIMASIYTMKYSSLQYLNINKGSQYLIIFNVPRHRSEQQHGKPVISDEGTVHHTLLIQ